MSEIISGVLRITGAGESVDQLPNGVRPYRIDKLDVKRGLPSCLHFDIYPGLDGADHPLEESIVTFLSSNAEAIRALLGANIGSIGVFDVAIAFTDESVTFNLPLSSNALSMLANVRLSLNVAVYRAAE